MSPRPAEECLPRVHHSPFKEQTKTKRYMKKTLLLSFAFFLTAFVATAQDALILSSPSVITPYQIVSVSPNGLYACGNVNDGYTRCFRWDLTSGEFRELSPMGETSAALGVSNDGTVVGIFMDEEALDNGAPIEAAGYWKDGSWHHIEGNLVDIPSSTYDGSQANCISPNGKLVGGLVLIDGLYTPVVWNIETGEMTEYIFQIPDEDLASSSAGAIYAVADDGFAAGYVYHHEYANRTPAIWLTPTDTILPNCEDVGPWAVAQAISEDGTKVLCDTKVYDRTTGEIYDAWSGDYADESDSTEYDFTACYINNEGTVVGALSTGLIEEDGFPVIIKDGTAYNLIDYLSEKGYTADACSLMIECTSLSSDEKVFTLYGYNDLETQVSMAIILDANITTPAPVRLKARAIDGAGMVALSWHKPLANADAVENYLVYCGDRLVYEGTDSLCCDTGLEEGEYTYTVRAVYAEATSDDSEEAVVTLSGVSLQSPRNFSAVQRGIRNVQLYWDEPASSQVTYCFAEEGAYVYSMGGGSYSFETGIRFRASQLAPLKEQDLYISGVNFYPMSNILSWELNLYSEDDLNSPLYTQTVDASTLTAGLENHVQLDTPFEIPEGKDLVVGVVARVDDELSNYKVQGMTYGICEAGYTDLMRRVDMDEVEDFYSMFDECFNMEDASYMYETTWPTSLTFAAKDASENKVLSYAYYADGVQVSTTTGTDVHIASVADGDHTFAVSALYADDQESAQVEDDLTVEAETDDLKPQNLVASVDGGTMTATWEGLSIDANSCVLTYALGENAGGVVGQEAYNYSYLARANFNGTYLRPYDGYLITGLRFYPTANADFTFFITKDEVQILDLEVPDYTLDEWNEVTIDEPIEIDRNAEYGLIIDCYDVDAEEAPIGMDDTIGRSGLSDLYMQSGESEYTSYSTESSRCANWMIGFRLQTAETVDLGLQGYKVYIDGALENEELLAEETYSKSYESSGVHNIRVRSVYEEGEYATSFVYYTIDLSGIAETLSNSTLEVTRGAGKLQVIGAEVKSLSLHALSGAQVGRSSESTISVAGLQAGTYLLTIEKADGTTVTKKLLLQ